MDCAVSSSWRCAGDAGRRLGAGQFASFLGRRNARNARSLWAQSALYKDGGAGHGTVEGSRGAMEAEFFSPYRRAVDGGKRWRIRARIATDAQGCRHILRATSGKRAVATLEADQL